MPFRPSGSRRNALALPGDLSRPAPGSAPRNQLTDCQRRDRILPHLAALSVLLLLAARHTPDRARKASVTAPAQIADLIDQLRATGTVLTYDPGTRSIRAGDEIAVAVTARQRS
jgi:hypothetical protein